jgi:hypothetical protein
MTPLQGSRPESGDGSGHPCLGRTGGHARTHRVADDPLRITAVVLEIYRVRYPVNAGADLGRWIEQLALDTIHARSTP